MGIVTVLNRTTSDPFVLSGFAAGTCWGANTNDEEKNFNRGQSCYAADHMRTAEYPQIYLILDGYSAKVIREWYTHIIDTSRMQASTRYMDYKNFAYIVPPSIVGNEKALDIYVDTMDFISKSIEGMLELGVPNEDATMILPLAYSTKIVVRIGLREFMNMCRKRRCSRAYWEYRQLMDDIIEALCEYSEEYQLLKDEGYFDAQCEVLGYCPEEYSCGRKIKKADAFKILENYKREEENGRTDN